MKNIVDIFKNFKSYHDITSDEYANILKYYAVFFEKRQYPRFFQSYLYVRAERKYFYYGFVNDCFVLVKKYKQFGNRIFYLPLPPMHIDGNLDKELSLINFLASKGIKTKLSEEDLELYNIPKKNNVKKDKDNIEHIYAVKDFANLDIPTFFKFRYNVKKMISHQLNGDLSINILNRLNEQNINQLNDLTSGWSKFKSSKTKKAFQADLCHNYFNDNGRGTYQNSYFEILKNDNKIIASSINETVGNNKIIITTNYSDYNAQFKDLQSNKALHCLIMQYWNNVNENTLCNSGSAGWDKGLYKHKQQLRPIKELQIYDNNISNYRLTEDEYQSMCQGSKK